jgi:hypothetical protein
MPVLKISTETHEQLGRLSALYELPMAKIVALYADAREEMWRRRMTADEWTRYLAEDVSRAESRKIRVRAEAGTNGHDTKAAAAADDHEAIKPLLDKVPLKKELAQR